MMGSSEQTLHEPLSPPPFFVHVRKHSTVPLPLLRSPPTVFASDLHGNKLRLSAEHVSREPMYADIDDFRADAGKARVFRAPTASLSPRCE